MTTACARRASGIVGVSWMFIALGCGSSGNGSDARAAGDASDGLRDRAIGDVAADAPADVPSDTISDARTTDSKEAGADAPSEVRTDVAIDASVDGSAEGGTDSASDHAVAGDGSVEVMPADASLEAAVEAAPEVPSVCGDGVVGPGEDCDPPNGAVCDAQCHAITIACGDGIVQPGEGCEGVSLVCNACAATPTAACVYFHAGSEEAVCSALSGAAAARCWALLNCMSIRDFGCATNYSCYCTPSDCSSGVNGPCAQQVATVAGTNDPAQLKTFVTSDTGPVGHELAALEVETAQYSSAEACWSINQFNGYVGAVVINEVQFAKSGTDSAEFVEIVNGTANPVSLSGVNLYFFRTTAYELFLTIPLSGQLRAGEYLVVGSPSLVVPSGVQKIDFAMSANNIDNALADVVLSGYDDILPVPGSGSQTLPDPRKGSLCREANGFKETNNVGFSVCSPTPGRPN